MLIGLNGRLGAGKDTAAARIQTMVTDREIELRAFANPLKDSAAALFGISRDELEWMKLDPDISMTMRVPLGPPPDIRYRTKSFTGRQYLERYGTEAHRDIFGGDFWLDQALPEGIDHYNKLIILTDCRFENEAKRVRQQGGSVIEVVGPRGREGNGHPSDTPLDDTLVDVFIDNSVHDDDYANLDAQLRIIFT